MKNPIELIESAQKLSITRRGFISAAAGMSALTATYGCSKDDDGDTYVIGGGTADADTPRDDIYYTENPVFRFGTTGHNCGGRCLTRAQVMNGRIIRFLTDEAKYAYDGVTSIDDENRNSTQSKACGRCRAYRGRLYHPGRLKYPLKQTKQRGDTTGFVRISWKEALNDISERLIAVQDAYGATSAHAIYACGSFASQFQGGSYTGVFGSNDWGALSPAMRLLGGGTQYTSDYSFHQASYMGDYGPAFSGIPSGDGEICVTPSSDDIAGAGKYIVLWGANIPTTHNPKAYPWIKGIEDMKNRDASSRVIFIGPEFSECAISIADEWVKIKPYTDTALVMGMLYYLLDQTLRGNELLDFDYLDTAVYGFFDSPGYWIDGTGNIIVDNDKSTNPGSGYEWVSPVTGGTSLASYLLGSNDNRLQTRPYGTSNYIAKTFTEAGFTNRQAGTSSYTTKPNSLYAYKWDLGAPKDVAWASGITGIPEATIIDLAEMYAKAGKEGLSLWNEWSGGQMKQADGCVTLFAIHALLITTKIWGVTGSGIKNQGMGRSFSGTAPAQFASSYAVPSTWSDGSIPDMPTHPQPSVIQWHNAVKFAFGTELKNNGYAPNIPDWTDLSTGTAFWDDGGTKALVKRSELTTLPGGDEPAIDSSISGGTYYAYDKDGSGQPVYSGFRFILNTGGNIPVNQHPNCKDSTDMYRRLPSYNHENGYNTAMKDAFYLVTFDNFMAPSARYSDYVLPAKTAWEQEDFVGIEAAGSDMYCESTIPGPGESMATWDFAREFIKAYHNLRDGSGSEKAMLFTGKGPDTTFRQVVQEAFADFKAQRRVEVGVDSAGATLYVSNPYYNKTWDEYLEQPLQHAKPSTTATSGPSKKVLRQALDDYLASANKTNQPFYMSVETADYNTIYGFGHDEFAETDTCPRQSKRFHVYSGSLVWRYTNLYSKWHGYLPKAQQGQKNEDSEQDPVVYPIPMYFDYRDYFREAYGLPNVELLEGRKLLCTTHDRFRAHSSQAENPYLRELTHRIVEGDLYSGNDAGTYALSSNPNGDFSEFPPLNTLIDDNGQPIDRDRASYADIWVNDEDFEDMPDGALVKVYNEIGAVYCTLRKTKRCVKGHVNLHQGCWYDPRTIDGEIVDVGGNCNTLMASKPSRMDHGNAQQSAMVNIVMVAR